MWCVITFARVVMYDPPDGQRPCRGDRSVVPVRLDGIRHGYHGVLLCELHGIVVHGAVTAATGDGKGQQQAMKTVGGKSRENN